MGLRRGKRRGILKAVLTVMLSLAIVMGIIPGTDFVMPIYADGDKTISGLGTGAIGNPTSGAGGWSYVYYGKYNGNPVKYRVLDKSTTEFNSDTDNANGRKTMLLDCDSTLDEYRFDVSDNYWGWSEIKRWLNGVDFLNKAGVFTDPERNAIATSTKISKVTGDGDVSFLNYAALRGEQIFLLDAGEATRASYGYSSTDSNSTRIKKGADDWWWLRSPYDHSDRYAGFVDTLGLIQSYDVDRNITGVSPAFNIDLGSVIFASVISGESGSYKLTIADAGLDITSGTITRSDSTINVPYTITGTANRVSVLITDSAYSAGTAATSGYTYLKLSGGVSGSGTFTLPAVYADKTCGTDYYTYILAEYVNDGKDTDYACTPVEITIPDASGGGLDLKPDPKHDDGDDSDNGSSDPKPKDEKLDELRANLKTAIDKGGYQTVTWDKGTALPYDIMKTLQDNPKITLVFSYTYENVFFKVTLPGQSVKAYTNIPWYGPLYLYAYYGGCGAIPECPED